MNYNVTKYDHAKLLSDHVQRLRKYNNISQEMLAQQTQVSIKTVQNIEECNTDPRLSTIVPICNTLNLDARLFITPDLIRESAYASELSMILSDCNDVEASAIINVAKNVKGAIRHCNASGDHDSNVA